MLDLAVAELAHDLEDLGPRRIHALVDLLVRLDRHHEFELLVGHLALLGGLAVVTASAAGAASALQAGVTALLAAAPLGAGVAGFRRRALAPLHPAAAVDGALTPVRATTRLGRGTVRRRRGAGLRLGKILRRRRRRRTREFHGHDYTSLLRCASS